MLSPTKTVRSQVIQQTTKTNIPTKESESFAIFRKCTYILLCRRTTKGFFDNHIIEDQKSFGLWAGCKQLNIISYVPCNISLLTIAALVIKI